MLNTFKNTWKWGLWYFVTVGVFSLIYWFAWAINPDSFIVHSDLNLSPMSDLYHTLWTDHQYTTKSNLISLNKLQIKLDEVVVKKSALYERIGEYETKEKNLQKQLDEAVEKHSQVMWENTKKYEKKQLEEILSKVSAKEMEISDLEKVSQSDKFKGGKLWTATAAHYFANKISNLKIELAELRIELAEKRYEVSSYILRNLRGFADPQKFDEVTLLEEQLSGVRKSISSLSADLASLRGEMHDLLKLWFSQRAGRLTYLDFLYYSIGISTTTTFGDIVANNKLIRLAVVIQLIISIFLVGGFVSRATKREEALIG